MLKINPKNLIFLIIPLLFFKPVWDLFNQLNRGFWGSVKNAISFFEYNPFVSILLFVILYLIFSRKH